MKIFVDQTRLVEINSILQNNLKQRADILQRVLNSLLKQWPTPNDSEINILCSIASEIELLNGLSERVPELNKIPGYIQELRRENI